MILLLVKYKAQDKDTLSESVSHRAPSVKRKTKTNKEDLQMAEITLEERAREERREYYRQWRAKNPDKVKENNRRYWEKRAAKKDQAEQEAG